MDGLKDDQIAECMGINRATFYRWKNKYPEFEKALAISKEIADREIENALFKAARKGNITAMIFWLKNRKPDEWRDRRDPDIAGDILTKVDEVVVKIKQSAEGLVEEKAEPEEGTADGSDTDGKTS